MSFGNWISQLKCDVTRTVNIDEGDRGGVELHRQLGLLSVFLFTVTQAVGAGILTTPGIIAQSYAGSQAYMSFLTAGLVCAPAALCLARMASYTSRGGSTGSYACAVLGQFVGLLMFVDVMLECIGGTAAVAVSQADHIKLILRLAGGIHLPDAFTQTPAEVNWWSLSLVVAGTAVGLPLVRAAWRRLTARTESRPDNAVLPVAMLFAGLALLVVAMASAAVFALQLPSINLLSIAVVAVVTVVLLRGVQETKWVTNSLTILKLIVIGAIVVIFAAHFNWDNIARAIPPGLPGVVPGASIAFFAFVGIDLATTTAGETENPKRNVPLGMLLGLVAVTVLYVAAAFFLCGAVPFEMLSQAGEENAAPMAKGLAVLGYNRAAIWVAAGSTAALLSVVLATMYSTTRLVHNIAQHRMLPPCLGSVSGRRRVPVVATLLVAAAVATLTGLLAVGELMHLTNIGTMTAFITVSLTVLVKTIKQTRWTESSAAAAAGTFWVVVAVLGMSGSAWLMSELPWTAFARLIAVWSAVALLFVFYSRHQVRKYDLNGAVQQGGTR
jgi:APA family basic amino acid/polyamine antiporter